MNWLQKINHLQSGQDIQSIVVQVITNRADRAAAARQIVELFPGAADSAVNSIIPLLAQAHPKSFGKLDELAREIKQLVDYQPVQQQQQQQVGPDEMPDEMPSIEVS